MSISENRIASAERKKCCRRTFSKNVSLGEHLTRYDFEDKLSKLIKIRWNCFIFAFFID